MSGNNNNNNNNNRYSLYRYAYMGRDATKGTLRRENQNLVLYMYSMF